jgi:hypothetical protein
LRHPNPELGRNWRAEASFNQQGRFRGASMSADTEDDEPETLPEEIVHWQPNHRPLAQADVAAARAVSATGGTALGALALGALALGAIAIGAVTIGAVAIGRLRVRRARFGRLTVDELVVGRFRVLERD